jgi:hypothetical protein
VINSGGGVGGGVSVTWVARLCPCIKSLGHASFPGGGDGTTFHFGENQFKPGAGTRRFGDHTKIVITEPPKHPQPSKQTQILLDTMSRNTEEENTKWDQVMEHFDLLFTQLNDLSVVQQQLKSQMDIRGAAMDQYS